MSSSFILNKTFLLSFCEIVFDLSPPLLVTLDSSILQDRENVLDILNDLVDQPLHSHQYSPHQYSLSPFIREILVSLQQDFFPYLAMEIQDCSNFFHEIDQRCEEIWNDTAASPSSPFEDLLFLTRLKMFCLLVNQYFFTDLSHRWYLCDQWIQSFCQLTNSAIGRVIIDDEFEPLLLPRRSDHNHLTRVPLLRHLSRLNDLILTYFQTRAEIFSSEGKSCEMYRVARTWTYRCIYQPHPPPPSNSKLPKKQKKKKPLPPPPSSTPAATAVKVHCVCCSPDGLF
jgi:hypothetical protein